MSSPEVWGKVVQSYSRTHPPEILWFISHAEAQLSLGDGLTLLEETSKVILDIAWLDSGMLVIIWACGSENGVTDILMDFARTCKVPITILAY
jgi:hypothetical protein